MFNRKQNSAMSRKRGKGVWNSAIWGFLVDLLAFRRCYKKSPKKNLGLEYIAPIFIESTTENCLRFFVVCIITGNV